MTGAFDHLESSLRPDPLFPCEVPDRRKDLCELDRQLMFRKYAAQLAPAVMVWANANAGKRNPVHARKEGIRAGLFDMTCAWDLSAATSDACPQSICWIEFKGYSAAGQPGKLSSAQIEWGNDMHLRGFRVACFFSGKSAFDWLASLGAPIAGRVMV